MQKLARIIRSREGYSILEAVVAMTIFAVGVLALTQSYFGIVRAQVNARNHEIALQLARDRVEMMVNSVRYADIVAANFPDEDFGLVNGGEPAFQHFRRSVAIQDSTNAIGQSVLKEIDVQVEWQASEGMRNVNLNTVIARYKDIRL
jgi:type II secretory pathway pseudopilin PulG